MVESNNEFSIQPPCIYTRLVHFDQKSEFQPGHQDSGVFLYVDVDRLFKKFSGVKTTTRPCPQIYSDQTKISDKNFFTTPSCWVSKDPSWPIDYRF